MSVPLPQMSRTRNSNWPLIRQQPWLIFFFVIVIFLPVLVVGLAWYFGKIEQPWKSPIIWGLIIGWPPALWYITDWVLKLLPKVESQSVLEFPYKIFSPKDLPSNLTTLSRPDIPYVPRLPAPAFKQMLKVLADAQYLLIIGRPGLGKTREAVELIHRIEIESGEEVSVLVPDGVLDIPFKISGEKINRKVILFIDDLPSRYLEARRMTDVNDLRSIADDFRERFEQTIRVFKDYYRSKFYVIATAIGEPDLRERLQLGDPFWKKFQIYELPDLAEECRPDFLRALERNLEIEITEDAKALLTERSDGTYSGLIVPLVRERSKRKIDRNDAEQYRCTYPQDWEQRVYKPVFEPNIYRRNLLAALSIVRQAQLTPFEFFVIDIAARLTAKEVLFWHRWRLRLELKKLSDWIEVSDGLLSCPDAYLKDKGDLANSQQALRQSVVHLMGREAYFHSLRPSVYQLINVLRYKLNDPWSALEINKKFTDISPEDGRAWNRLAFIYLQLNDYELAEKACLTAIRFGDHSSAWSALATIYVAQRKYQKAIQACQSAIERDEKRAIFWAYLGVILSKIGQLDAAIAAGEKAVALDPYNPFAHVSLSISYDQAGLLDKAIDTCNRAIVLDGQSATSWQTLGVTFSKAKQFDKAIEACTKATELEPESSVAWGLLARVFEDVARFDEAIVAHEKAVNLEPQNARNWLSLGIALDHAGYSQDAFEVLKEATELDSELVPAWQALARISGRLDRKDVVFSALEKVTTLVPKSAQDWFILGVTYFRNQRYTDAAAALSRATELRPDMVKTWKDLFVVHNKLRDYRSALHAMERVVVLERDDPTELYKLGVAYSRVNQTEKSIEVLQRTIGLAPQMKVAWQALRRIYKRINKTEEVLTVSLKLVELEPKRDGSWLTLGLTYKNMGDTDKAAEAFCRAIVYSTTREILMLAVKWLENLEKSQPHKGELRDLAALVSAAQNARDNDDFERAIRFCNRAIAMDSEAIGAWRTLSSAYRRSGKHEEALVAAQRVVDIFGSSAGGWYVLGLRYDQLGKTAEATSAFEHALKLDASYTFAQRKLAQKLMSSGNCAKAIRFMRKIILNNPSKADWITYGHALTKVGRYDQATYAFDQVAKLITNTAKSKTSLGHMYLLSLSFPKARTAFHEALALDSEFQDATNGLQHCNDLELKHPRIRVVKDEGIKKTQFRSALT